MWRFDSSRESRGLVGEPESPPPRHGGDRGFKSRQDRSVMSQDIGITRGSYGETEIMPAYGAGGGGSSPPGKSARGHAHHGARLAGGGRRPAKPSLAGFESLARLHGPPSKGPGQRCPEPLMRVRIAPGRQAVLTLLRVTALVLGRPRQPGTVTSQDDEGQRDRRGGP
jgi:hypothetical protein